MKILHSIFLVLILFIPMNLFSAYSDNKTIKPVNAKSTITTIVSGTSRAYYPLSSKNSSLLTLKGQGQLKIITRVRFIPNEKSTISYKINYRIDGGIKNVIDFKNVHRSKTAIYKIDTLGIPGEEGDIIIKLGGGEHNIKVWLDSENPKVASRYIFTPKYEKKLTWGTMNPLIPNEPVNLITDEEEIKYFRFSNTQPMVIKITGPTKLRILTRIENHYLMKGRIDYRLQVKEDAKVKRTYQLSSIRSETTCYKKDDSKIPGKAKEIIIDVPKGTHQYEILPLDKFKSTVLGRVLFPKRDIKLEAREE
jgi:hypothetical protein